MALVQEAMFSPAIAPAGNQYISIGEVSDEAPRSADDEPISFDTEELLRKELTEELQERGLL